MSRSKYYNTIYCPVCNRPSKNLYELNVHLDQDHFDVAEKQKETVKSWLKKRVDEAKQLASIVVTQHYFHKEFELNENHVETQVTKKHWQIDENVPCFFESCHKILVSKGERVNCKKCGKLFCNIHTSYQIKLSQDAQHDPDHGVWSRVCKYCYEEREGYMDTNGPVIDYFPEFKHFRAQAVDKINLHANRLEKRVSKLFELLILDSKNEATTNSFYKLVNSFKSRKKALEQTIVSWEDDVSVTHCPICKRSFNYTDKKHHCRLCGKIICANSKTQCSSIVQLNMKSRCLNAFNSKIVHENSTNASVYSDLSIRICKNCRHIAFSRKEFSDCLSKSHPLVTLYKELSTLRHKIEILFSDFKSQLNELKKVLNNS
ncbi:hypothetical protein T552_00231 [Pneumocystis carinii B80]|uniref:FYVE-type domain-containing protein n=1 Tax=Pneumocystis carinii (strain B80) TaxID=1408658 RepID=A0A0W4ZT83_PNEC8|nr:hypothetical protein T552_00231 [Pneumocystis carinii B80]KTW31593.1 hypothetical protein T552_00231 [Pneumocystis carinii B80]